MSRSRSGSRASRNREPGASDGPGSTVYEPFAIRFMHLPQPSLLTAYNVDRPELPALPQPELVLPRGATPAYVGEEFQCLVAVQRRGVGGPGSPGIGQAVHEARLRVEAQAPDGPRAVVLDEAVQFSADEPFAVKPVALDVRVPGQWVLLASLRTDTGRDDGLQKSGELLVRQTHKVEAQAAISVRTKVSRGSSALDAHVVEAQVENLSDSTLLIESLALNPSNGWEAIAPSSAGPEQETTGGSIALRPHDVQQWSFVLRGGWAAEAGPLAIGWRREPLGARGWQTTGSIRV